MIELKDNSQRCACRHLFSAHGPSGCHAVMTITPVAQGESGRVPCDCDRWPPMTAEAEQELDDEIAAQHNDDEYNADAPFFIGGMSHREDRIASQNDD